MKFKLVIITIFLCVSNTFAAVRPIISGAVITAGNYGLGAKLNILSNFGTELRYNFGADIRIFIGRVTYNYVFVKSPVIPYAGLDLGYIDFDYEGTKGSGTIWSIFVGSEIRITKNLTFSGDIGYSNVTVRTSEFAVTGPEYIYNLGINWYIFK